MGGNAWERMTAYQGSTPMNDGEWHHIAGVRKSAWDAVYLYVDGIQVGSTTNDSVNSTNNTSPVQIGNLYNYPDLSYHFDGLIDSVAIYDRGLSATEILDRYNGGELIGYEAGLVSCWNFNEEVDSTAFDCTANGNDGTIYGAIYAP